MSSFPPATSLPTTEPQIILAFHGLMSLSFKSPEGNGNNGFCEVGIHDNAPHHDLKLKVFDIGDNPSNNIEPFYTFNFATTHPSPTDLIRFDAVNANPQRVGFYEPLTFAPGTATQGRFVADPFDFRLVNDFEGPEFYNRTLDKNLSTFRPRLFVKSGIFVTLVRTTKEFKREAPLDPLKLGSVAEIAGAGIYLQPDGVVGLRFGQQAITLPLKPGGRTLYLFLFDNACPPEVCNFEHTSPIKERRNDFFEYYKMFRIPDDKEEFELKSDPSAGGPATEEPATIPGRANYVRVRSFLLANVVNEKSPDATKSNNEAPCGPGAFGGG